MTDYSPNGSVPPLLPGDAYFQNLVSNKASILTTFVLPLIDTSADLPANAINGSMCYVLDIDTVFIFKVGSSGTGSGFWYNVVFL